LSDLSARLPKYRRHSSGRGFVEHGGKRHYLAGAYNSPESVGAYKAFVREVCGSPIPTSTEYASCVAVVVSRFLQWAELYYPGRRGTYDNLRYSLLPLVPVYGRLPPHEFGPKKLKEYQAQLAEGKKSRDYINDVCRRIKQCFKWAASEELIPVAVYQALATVPGLKLGRTNASEPTPRTMVPWEDVAPVLPHLSATLKAMVEIHWLTGVRSGSICLARPEQFDITKVPWEWRPRHKTEHQGAELVVFVGPQARKLLAPLIEATPKGGYLFRPADARRNKRYGSFYTSQSYRQAVERGIARANAQRALEDAALPEDQRRQPLDWTPHAIRHAKGTLTRAKYGIEGAQASLGHKRLDATQVYAARLTDAARTIAEAEG
jgi:integrase